LNCCSDLDTMLMRIFELSEHHRNVKHHW
jgi:hypothetical protein